MRNLISTNLASVSIREHSSPFRQFCVDADKLWVWLVTDNELYSIDANGTVCRNSLYYIVSQLFYFILYRLCVRLHYQVM